MPRYEAIKMLFETVCLVLVVLSFFLFFGYKYESAAFGVAGAFLMLIFGLVLAIEGVDIISGETIIQTANTTIVNLTHTTTTSALTHTTNAGYTIQFIYFGFILAGATLLYQLAAGLYK